MKTPEQIADEVAVSVVNHHVRVLKMWGTIQVAKAAALAAIEADRAQRREIHIVQDDAGDVIDVFYDRDEARESCRDRDLYSVIEETVWEPGEYAAARANGRGA